MRPAGSVVCASASTSSSVPSLVLRCMRATARDVASGSRRASTALSTNAQRESLPGWLSTWMGASSASALVPEPATTAATRMQAATFMHPSYLRRLVDQLGLARLVDQVEHRLLHAALDHRLADVGLLGQLEEDGLDRVAVPEAIEDARVDGG